PALAAGCTVVLKPAPDTPWSGAVLGQVVAEETEIPAGVLNVVTSSDKTIGEVLSTDPRVDLVSFTGSTATGRRIMRDAADTVKRLFLELGGKSASIVLADADLEAACAACAFPVTVHAGQGCAITTRALIPRDRFDDAVEILRDTLASTPFGDPMDEAVLMGPLVSASQLERVDGFVRRAVSNGARAVTGGKRPVDMPERLAGGFWYEPTLLVDVGPSDEIAQQEVFGPVLVAMPYEDDDDAVAIANDSIYGLSGAVFSSDVDHAIAVARRIRTGSVSINGGQIYGPDVPFGGYRQSGIGREMGVAGFEEYLESKAFAEPST
ncbi:MAG: aldehyde dehydrogenase family protein, partial [Actinobacteria bacterium ATB1]|nr:aldehyde dehydrogenase family protein [Actinobacteria bacterium ATB1]